MSELGSYLGWKEKALMMENPTVRDVLVELANQDERFQHKIFDPLEDKLTTGIVILINGINTRQMENLDTLLSDNVDLTIYFPLGGG